MSPDIIYRDALYLGSIPFDADSSCRAEFVQNKLESMQSFAWCKPIMLCISTSGVKVCDPTCKTIFMVHALRRISYATSDTASPKFVFLAREANMDNPSQFCHIFATDTQSRAEELNRIIGDAFRLAFAKQRLAKQVNYAVTETDDDDDETGDHRGSEAAAELPTLSSLHAPILEPSSSYDATTEPTDFCEFTLPPPPSSPPPPIDVNEENHINGNSTMTLPQPASDPQLLPRHQLVVEESEVKQTTHIPSSALINATNTSSSDDSGSQQPRKSAKVRHSLGVSPAQPSASTRGNANCIPTSSTAATTGPSVNHVFNMDLVDVTTSNMSPVVTLKMHLDNLALKEQPAPPPKVKPDETPSRFRLRGPRARAGREAAESAKARRSLMFSRGDRPLSQIICLDSALLLKNSPSFATQQQPRSEEQLMSNTPTSADSGAGSQENEFFSCDSANTARLDSPQRSNDSGGIQDNSAGMANLMHNFNRESEAGGVGIHRLTEVCPVPNLPSVASDSILLPAHASFIPASLSAAYDSTPNMVPCSDTRQQQFNHQNSTNGHGYDRDSWRPSPTSAFTNASGCRKSNQIPQLPLHAVLDNDKVSANAGYNINNNNGCQRVPKKMVSSNCPRFTTDLESAPLCRAQKQTISDWNSEARGPPSTSTETPTPTATPTPTPTPTPGKFLAPSAAIRKGANDVVGSVYHTPWFQAFLPRDVALELLTHEEAGAFLVRDSVTHPSCWALSVRVPEHVNCVGITHYLIQHSQNGVKLKGLDKEWPSLNALITHLTVIPEMLPCPLRMPSFTSNPSFVTGGHDVIDDVLPPLTTSALSSLSFPPPPPPPPAMLHHSVTAPAGDANHVEMLRYGDVDESLVFDEGGTLNGPPHVLGEAMGGEEYQRLSDFSSMLADMKPAAVYR